MIKGRIKQIPRSDWALGYTHRSPVNSQRSDQSGHDTRIWIQAPPVFFSASPTSSMPSLPNFPGYESSRFNLTFSQ